MPRRTYHICIWVFLKCGIAKTMVVSVLKLSNLDVLGVPPFWETSICMYIYIYF